MFSMKKEDRSTIGVRTYLSKNVSTIVKIVHSSTDNDVGDYTPPKKFFFFIFK